MIQVFIFLALTLLALAAGGRALVYGILTLINPGRVSSLKRAAALFAAFAALDASLVFYTQWTASTPAVKDERGNLLAGGIAELRQVELNGRREWVSVRGRDKSSPVLLFLAGGPGGSQMAAVRHDLKELEKHFVVVNWDQPGAGKSYWAADIKSLTPGTYIEDGYALTNYLRERFGQQKIFLVGESWGSALGIFLVGRCPEAYHAFVGTGQMVAFAETERMDYEKAMELARAAKDADIIKKLEENGPAPYYGKEMIWKSALYLNYLSSYMAANPEIHNPGYNTFRDLFSEEYGILDKINYIRGVIDTFNHVYPQLYDIDLRTDYSKLKAPVLFFIGRHDLNAPPSLAEEYAGLLEAPGKKIVWFEHSGHSPWINETDRFVEELTGLLEGGEGA